MLVNGPNAGYPGWHDLSSFNVIFVIISLAMLHNLENFVKYAKVTFILNIAANAGYPGCHDLACLYVFL